jgi:hypothetical protein
MIGLGIAEFARSAGLRGSGRNRPMDRELQEAAELRALIEAEPLPRNLAAFIDACATEQGDAPAANFFEAGIVISYRDLAEKTRSLAAGLAARGIGFGDRVGVMLPNTPVFPLTWLALARIGAPSAGGRAGRDGSLLSWPRAFARRCPGLHQASLPVAAHGPARGTGPAGSLPVPSGLSGRLEARFSRNAPPAADRSHSAASVQSAPESR